MKINKKFLVLSVLISAALLSFIGLQSVEQSFAQSEEDDEDDVRSSNNNVIGQDGNDNEASQSDETSQETDQDSMCVSGEITSQSCDNLSSELAGKGIPGPQGEPGPQGPQGDQGPPGPSSIPTTYRTEGNFNTNVEGLAFAVSIAQCEEGDLLMGGGHTSGTTNTGFVMGVKITEVNLIPNLILDPQQMSAQIQGDSSTAATVGVQGYAICMDITP